MSCRSCGASKYSPEHYKPMKPESHSGCGGKAPNDCKSPSDAAVGSPLYEWEQKYGRLIFRTERVIGEDGRWTNTYSKVPCPPEPKKKRGPSCCSSVRYRVTR